MSALRLTMDFLDEFDDIQKTKHRLPHWQQGRVPVFVTFRLSDSLPQQVLGPLLAVRDAFLSRHPKPWDEATEREFHQQYTAKLETDLDAGQGCCALRDSRVATIVIERLLHFDAQRYELHRYVIMPNHVHVLFSPHEAGSLPEIIKGWKGVSSRLIHQAGLCGLNPFWQPDYFDRLIRGPEHFEKVMAYIRENPVKAGLKEGFVLWERGHSCPPQ